MKCDFFSINIYEEIAFALIGLSPTHPQWIDVVRKDLRSTQQAITKRKLKSRGWHFGNWTDQFGRLFQCPPKRQIRFKNKNKQVQKICTPSASTHVFSASSRWDTAICSLYSFCFFIWHASVSCFSLFLFLFLYLFLKSSFSPHTQKSVLYACAYYVRLGQSWNACIDSVASAFSDVSEEANKSVHHAGSTCPRDDHFVEIINLMLSYEQFILISIDTRDWKKHKWECLTKSRVVKRVRHSSSE